MSTAFDAIGVPMGPDYTSWRRTTDRIASAIDDWTDLDNDGTGVHTGRHGHWHDPTGAGVDLYLPSTGRGHGGRPCASPQYAAINAHTVEITAVIEHPECRNCDLAAITLHGRDSPGVPLLISPTGIARDRDAITAATGRHVTARLAFLAEHIEPATTDAHGIRRADGHRPRATVTGTVPLASWHRTRLFTAAFWRLSMGTPVGLVDLLAAGSDLPNGIAPGRAISARVWVAGRLST